MSPGRHIFPPNSNIYSQVIAYTEHWSEQKDIYIYIFISHCVPLPGVIAYTVTMSWRQTYLNICRLQFQWPCLYEQYVFTSHGHACEYVDIPTSCTENTDFVNRKNVQGWCINLNQGIPILGLLYIYTKPQNAFQDRHISGILGFVYMQQMTERGHTLLLTRNKMQRLTLFSYQRLNNRFALLRIVGYVVFWGTLCIDV